MAAAPELPRRRLGRSELEVSRIALGSWRTFERMPRQAAEAVLGHARERGINFLDDARYDDETGRAPLRTGFSEVLFGELFRAVGWPRDDAIVSNKLWWEFWPQQTATQELEESLERMPGRLSAELDDPRLQAGLRVGAELVPLAQRMGTTPAALAVAFTLCHPRAASTLVGATAPRQLDEAIAAVALAERLTDQDLTELRALAERVSEPTDP